MNDPCYLVQRKCGRGVSHTYHKAHTADRSRTDGATLGRPKKTKTSNHAER